MKSFSVLCITLLVAAQSPAQNQAVVLATATNGYVAVTNNPTLVPALITVEAWVYFLPMNLAAAGIYPTILRKNVAAGQEVYFLRVQQSTGRVAWKVRLPVGSATATSPAALPTSTWTHLAGTWDGTTCRLYFNGVQVATATGTGAVADTGGDLRIGKGDDATGGGETWNGSLDEVRLWSVARSAGQIQGTMNWALDGIPGLTSVWHFDGSYSDSTGSNHGTPTGVISFAPSAVALNTGLPPYQVNSSLAQFDIDGVQGDPFARAIVNRTYTACAPAAATVNFLSSLVGQPYDLALTGGPAVPGNAGGLVTGGGQTVNLNLADPTLFFLNGFTFAIPFANASLPISQSSNLDLSAQMIIVAPGTPDNFALSGASELHVAQGATSIAGPALDDSGLTVQLSNPVFCQAPPSIVFFGVPYASFDVISNGRVMFGAPALNTTFTPSVAGAMTASYPFLGPWSDLNPGTGGSITIAAVTPGVMRISYNAVFYFATTIPNTFAIELDGTNGNVSITGLGGIAAHTAQQFLGISPGVLGPATDPGMAAFAVGGPFLPPLPTDMIYRQGTAGSLTPGMTRIDFIPSANSYAWLGF